MHIRTYLIIFTNKYLPKSEVKLTKSSFADIWSHLLNATRKEFKVFFIFIILLSYVKCRKGSTEEKISILQLTQVINAYRYRNVMCIIYIYIYISPFKIIIVLSVSNSFILNSYFTQSGFANVSGIAALTLLRILFTSWNMTLEICSHSVTKISEVRHWYWPMGSGLQSAFLFIPKVFRGDQFWVWCRPA